MTTIEPDLAALDWLEYACQCTHHPATGGCGGQATHMVAVHAIDRCDVAAADVDLFGNRIEFRCYECVSKLWDEIANRLAGLRAYGLGVGLSCSGCRKPIAQVSDILRSVERLR